MTSKCLVGDNDKNLVTLKHLDNQQAHQAITSSTNKMEN